MIDWLRGRRPAVAPDEVRAIRQEAGWTQAQVAEEMGVLPLEVSAWEAGAVPVDPYQAALIRWQIDQAQYAARLPRPDCDWTRANQARLERMREQGVFATQRAMREVAEHTRECAECMRAEMLLKEMPAAPEPPVRPGPRGWMDSVRRRIDRLPVWLRLPLVTAELLLGLVPAYLFYRLVRWGVGGEASVSPLGMLAIGAGFLWILVPGPAAAAPGHAAPVPCRPAVRRGHRPPGAPARGFGGQLGPDHRGSVDLCRHGEPADRWGVRRIGGRRRARR